MFAGPYELRSFFGWKEPDRLTRFYVLKDHDVILYKKRECWWQTINRAEDALNPQSHFTMRFLLQIVTTVSIALLLYSCSNVRNVFQRKERVYQPPRLGAEYRFEEGLRRQKNPQNLFSKKERKDMEKMGIGESSRQQGRSAPNVRISAMQADSLLTGKTRDTAQTVPIDSSLAKPADTVKPIQP